jgi:hypothetical protein
MASGVAPASNASAAPTCKPSCIAPNTAPTRYSNDAPTSLRDPRPDHHRTRACRRRPAPSRRRLAPAPARHRRHAHRLRPNHRRLAAELRDCLHHAGRTGETLDGVNEQRLNVARAAQRADETRILLLGAEQGHQDARLAVTKAIVDNAEAMRNVLDHASDALASKYQQLEAAAAAFRAQRDQTRARWEEYIVANEPDGTVRGWYRDAMRGDVPLEPEAGFRPRRAVDHVLTTGRPGRTENAQAMFTT